MTKSLPNRVAHPAILENPEHVADFVQEGFGGQVDFYNMFDEAILVGEPFIYMGRLAISKFVLLPGEPGQCHFGAWINIIVDPALASQILAGQKVYFDLDLADDDYPGYATNVRPTNGYFVGYATLDYDKNNMQLDVGTGKPVACSTSQARVGVLMHQEKMVKNQTFWGGVLDATDGDEVISS